MDRNKAVCYVKPCSTCFFTKSQHAVSNPHHKGESYRGLNFILRTSSTNNLNLTCKHMYPYFFNTSASNHIVKNNHSTLYYVKNLNKTLYYKGIALNLIVKYFKCTLTTIVHCLITHTYASFQKLKVFNVIRKHTIHFNPTNTTNMLFSQLFCNITDFIQTCLNLCL